MHRIQRVIWLRTGWLILLLLASTSVHIHSGVIIESSFYRKWRQECITEVAKMKDSSRNKWQANNTRMVVEQIDSTMLMQLYTTITNSYKERKSKADLYVLLYYTSGEVASIIVQFVVVDKKQCLTAQCTLEAYDTLYSDVELWSTQKWKRFLNGIHKKINNQEVQDDRFLLISHIKGDTIDCRAISIDLLRSRAIRKWFFS